MAEELFDVGETKQPDERCSRAVPSLFIDDALLTSLSFEHLSETVHRALGRQIGYLRTFLHFHRSNALCVLSPTAS